MKTLTVFTPTYNRETLLPRLYESLNRQSCKDFIWMIIDDGSSDNTSELVQSWMKTETSFPIEYYYKENGGLHTAYNEAIAHIVTPLCVCIDSDDWMPDNAVERILAVWQERGSDAVAGIVGLDCYEDGRVVGDPLPSQETVNLIDLLTGKYKIKNGDRTNVVRTELYKRVAPMKSFPGEKFFNPHYMHLQISQGYDFLVLNECLRYVEYQPQGMSAAIWKQYKNSPNSFAETRKLYLSFPNTSITFKLRQTIHFVSSCILAGELCKAIKDVSNKSLLLVSLPAGVLLAYFIRMQ